MKAKKIKFLLLCGILSGTFLYATPPKNCHCWNWDKSYFTFRRFVWARANRYNAKELLKTLGINSIQQLDKLWENNAQPFYQKIIANPNIPPKVKRQITILYKRGLLRKIYVLFAKLIEGYIPAG